MPLKQFLLLCVGLPALNVYDYLLRFMALNSLVYKIIKIPIARLVSRCQILSFTIRCYSLGFEHIKIV